MFSAMLAMADMCMTRRHTKHDVSWHASQASLCAGGWSTLAEWCRCDERRFLCIRQMETAMSYVGGNMMMMMSYVGGGVLVLPVTL
jgi:hypothetical protein